MGNFSTKDLRDLFDENSEYPPEYSPGTPVFKEKHVLNDPRSPLPNVSRTPIEVIKKGQTIKAEMTPAVDPALQRVKKQLGDPRSATKGIVRTPILATPSPPGTDSSGSCQFSDAVSSPTENNVGVRADCDDQVDEPKESHKDDTPTRVSEGSQKIVMPKKLAFDNVSLNNVGTRSPLGQVSTNSPDGGRKRRSRNNATRSTCVVSPAQLLHVRQRRAVRRALQEANAIEQPTPRHDQTIRI